MEMSFRADVKKTRRYLTSLQRRQLPFAAAKALSDTAFDVRKFIVNVTYPRDFKVRNRRFANIAFRVRRASKRDLRASVFDRLAREFLAIQAEGGVKTPRGRHLAIPVSEPARRLDKRARRGKGGGQQSGIADIPNTFVFAGAKGQLMIARRKGKKNKVEVLFTLVPKVTIPKRFQFQRDSERRAKRAFPVRFRRSMADALRTAR